MIDTCSLRCDVAVESGIVTRNDNAGRDLWQTALNTLKCSRAGAVELACAVLWRHHRRGATGRALDLRSTGRGFNSYSGQKEENG